MLSAEWPTLPSSGRAKACFAPFSPPLMSFVLSRDRISYTQNMAHISARRVIRGTTFSFLAFALVAAAKAEQFLSYEKDKATVTIFHMYPCKLAISSTGKEPMQQATVFSRTTNSPVAKGCWRFGDDSLIVLLKLEDGRQLRFSPLDLEKQERF